MLLRSPTDTRSVRNVGAVWAGASTNGVLDKPCPSTNIVTVSVVEDVAGSDESWTSFATPGLMPCSRNR
jgi:hypothetical protein